MGGKHGLAPKWLLERMNENPRRSCQRCHQHQHHLWAVSQQHKQDTAHSSASVWAEFAEKTLCVTFQVFGFPFS